MIFKASSGDGGDKRKHKRVKANNLIKIIKDEIGGHDAVLNIHDISEGGVGFRSKEEIKQGSVLKIVINLPEQNCDIEVEASVQWTHWLGGKDGYEMGVQFVKIKDDDRETLKHYIYKDIEFNVSEDQS